MPESGTFGSMRGVPAMGSLPRYQVAPLRRGSDALPPVFILRVRVCREKVTELCQSLPRNWRNSRSTCAIDYSRHHALSCAALAKVKFQGRPAVHARIRHRLLRVGSISMRPSDADVQPPARDRPVHATRERLLSLRAAFSA